MLSNLKKGARQKPPPDFKMVFMKIPTCLWAPILALAISSCSSENEKPVTDSSQEKDRTAYSTSNNSSEIGPWTVSEDDDRVRLEACIWEVQGEPNSTSITVMWSPPVNALPKMLYRLEIAEGEEFTTGYKAFANITDTVFTIGDLKSNTEYCLRLQAYLGLEDDSLAPSVPQIAFSTTARNHLNQVSNIELRIENGKFSAKWDPPANASGKLEYLVYLRNDGLLEQNLGIRLLKEPLIPEWIVLPGLNYWLQVQALPDPDSTNDRDSDSLPLVKEFYIPGNQLETPKNFRITPGEDQLNLSWDTISNNSQNFEYLLVAYLDEERTNSFGEYHLNVPKESISGVNQNPSYWFDLQSVPATGNHSDLPSETTSLFYELPSLTYPTPKISSMTLEPIDDPDNPGTLIKLKWEKPIQGDGRHKYRIEITNDLDFQTGVQDSEEDADSLSGEYGPLDPGKTYYMRMRAVGPPEDTTRINSEWSEIKTIVTLGSPSPVEQNE
jgi:hypothetical protein